MKRSVKIYKEYLELKYSFDDADMVQRMAHFPLAHKYSRSGVTTAKIAIREVSKFIKVFLDGDCKNKLLLAKAEEDELRSAATNLLLTYGATKEHEFLWDHQRLGVELADHHDKFGFFYDTRTGKTPMALEIMSKDIKKNGNKWLVICPLVLIEQAWKKDAQDMFPHLKVLSLHHKSRKKRLELFKQDADVYITNTEAVIKYADEIKSLGVHGVFLDESSSMKDPNTKFSLAAQKLSESVDKWYLLSGTPAPNNETEYYGQLRTLGRYNVPSSFTKFKEHFFVNVSYTDAFPNWKINPAREDELKALIKSMSYYVDQEDAIETAGRDFIPYKFDLPDDVKQHYKTMKNALFTQINEHSDPVVALSAVSCRNKLNQITSGFIIDSVDGETLSTIDLSDFRYKELKTLLDKHPDDQVIIWANFTHEFKRLKEILGDRCVEVHGKIPIDKKNEALDAFKAGKVQYLVANPKSADKGLTLTNAHICIYFSLNDSYESFKQSRERIYGALIKQPKRCIYYIMMANKTVDEIIYHNISNKGELSMAMLNHLKGDANDTFNK